jgi:5-oxoprolinase (ATP-hydrolysing)
MTNTRITDAEILEKTQPVILRQFQIRPGSGGVGRHRGGDGVVRKFEFTEAMQVATIGERRVTQPYGMKEGGPGQRGAFYFSRKGQDGTYVTVKTKPSCTVKVRAGDRVVLHTPGGGGWGEPGDVGSASTAVDMLRTHGFIPRANGSWASRMATANASN